jgi:hypothetical protein
MSGMAKGPWGHRTTVDRKEAPDWWRDLPKHHKLVGAQGPDGVVWQTDGKPNSGKLIRHSGWGRPGDASQRLQDSQINRTNIIRQEQQRRDQEAQSAINRKLGRPDGGRSAGLGGGLGGKTPQTPQTGSYQSSINVGGGIGKGGVLAGLLDTGSSPNPNVSAFMRATSRNDASQIGRAVDGQNQQLFMDQQAKRAESTTQGASNLAQIYGDYAERGAAQIGLAADILKNNIGFAGGIASMGMRGMS